MYDSFDMACHDEDPDLRLNIKVNSENLLPTSQKYNLGSLRLPADPSWPKIPQRRLADDGDSLQSPHVANLTGTPIRSRTIVRAPRSRSSNFGTSKDLGNLDSHHICQKTQISHGHQPKKRSGCIDPRFKKVTKVKSQMTSTDSGEYKIDEQMGLSYTAPDATQECKSIEEKTVSQKDSTRPQVILQQEAEKPDETKTAESIGVQTVQTISSEITSDMNLEVNKKNSREYVESRRKSCSPVKNACEQFKIEAPRPTGMSVQNKSSRNFGNNTSFKNNDLVHEPSNSKNPEINQTSPSQYYQGKEGQLMAEKNVQATNITTPSIIHPTSVQNNQCPTQSYNVQVPMLSHQNVPVQISTQPQSKIDIPPQISDLPNSNFNSASLFKSIDVPKLELPNDTVPQFRNLATSLMNAQYQKFSSQQRSNANFHSKLEPMGLQPVIGLEKVMTDIDSEEKCCSRQNIPNDCKNTKPKHNFHIHYHEGELFQSHCTNIPKELYNHTVTANFDPERLDNSNNENCNFGNQKDPLSKNENYFYVQQQNTDSESSKEKNHYSHSPERWNSIFLNEIENHDNKKFQSLNHKAVYFEENSPRVWATDSKCRTMPVYDPRFSSLRQKRKMKSEQHLMLGKKRVQSSEPQITCNQRLVKIPCLKKANSYLWKCTQKLTANLEPSHIYRQRRRRSLSNHRAYVDNMGPDGNNLLPSSQHTAQGNNINFIDCKENNGRVIPPTDLNDVKREHCIKPYQRPSNKNAKVTSSLDLRKQNLSLTKALREDTGLQNEKPTAIPIKTQELLNKSYWDYYNKLKLYKMENGESAEQQYFCQVAMGAPQSKKKKPPELNVEDSNDTSQVGEQIELSLPEIRTLEQCSVLSTMINKTLDSTLQLSSEPIQTKQIYMNGNMRSSSDPTAGTESAVPKKLLLGHKESSIISSAPLYKHKHKQDNNFNSRTLKLKSICEHPIVFFGCMVYAMIVFLPMVYDYFFYEDHNEYEDLSYVEIVFDYIITSFKDGLEEFFVMMNKIFFKPDARMQRLSSGKWRQKISKQHLI